MGNSNSKVQESALSQKRAEVGQGGEQGAWEWAGSVLRGVPERMIASAKMGYPGGCALTSRVGRFWVFWGKWLRSLEDCSSKCASALGALLVQSLVLFSQSPESPKS